MSGRRLTEAEKLRLKALSLRREADANAKRYAARRMAAEVGDVSRDEIIARDGQTCYLCGEWMSVHEITFDHVQPLSRGGTHTADNIKLAHKLCNQQKSATAPEGWAVKVKPCEQCGKMFAPESRSRKPPSFCSRACYLARVKRAAAAP